MESPSFKTEAEAPEAPDLGAAARKHPNSSSSKPVGDVTMWLWLLPSSHPVSGCFLLNHLWGWRKPRSLWCRSIIGFSSVSSISRSIFSQHSVIQLIDYWLLFKDPAHLTNMPRGGMRVTVSSRVYSANHKWFWSSGCFRICHLFSIIATPGQHKQCGVQS